MVSEERQVFQVFIKSQGLKDTAQRNRVLDTFLRTEEHLSVEDIYRLVNKKGRVGYATVHRTMKLMTECGLAREVVFDDGVCRFEHSYRHEHHHHLVCTRCRRVIEFTSEAMDRAEKAILKKHGFWMESHQYKVFGICRECQRKTNRGGDHSKARREKDNGRRRKQTQSR